MPKGTGIVIKGTVLDMSPAQPGTPCVSKDSMAIQMETLHRQMPVGGLWGNETVIGVPVTLTAISSSGSYIDLGTVTTDGYYGTFSKTWIPPAEGDYKIIASFAGDESYGSSSASTDVSVGSAATASTPIEPEPQQPTTPDQTPDQSAPDQTTPEEPTSGEPEPQTASEIPLISTELAIVIAVVAACIIGVVAYIALKKRK